MFKKYTGIEEESLDLQRQIVLIIPINYVLFVTYVN